MGHLSSSIFEVRHKCTTRQSTSDYHTATFRAHVKGVKRGLAGDFLGNWGPSGTSWGIRSRGSIFEVQHKCTTRKSTSDYHTVIFSAYIKGARRRSQLPGGSEYLGGLGGLEPREPQWCRRRQGEGGRGSIFEVRQKCTTSQSTSDYHTATLRTHVKRGTEEDFEI